MKFLLSLIYPLNSPMYFEFTQSPSAKKFFSLKAFLLSSRSKFPVIWYVVLESSVHGKNFKINNHHFYLCLLILFFDLLSVNFMSL